ncbi:unnamed protein product [Linum trigynum]|uniref:Uncharacterized protein n=1 Tax=Linum trigynum TaxID=586398 RepID=A0AAV2EX46_9ROSI
MPCGALQQENEPARRRHERQSLGFKVACHGINRRSEHEQRSFADTGMSVIKKEMDESYMAGVLGRVCLESSVLADSPFKLKLIFG